MKKELEFFNQYYLPIYLNIEVASRAIAERRLKKLTLKENVILSLVELITKAYSRQNTELSMSIKEIEQGLSTYKLELLQGYFKVFDKFLSKDEQKLNSILLAIKIGKKYEHLDLLYIAQIVCSSIYYVMNEKEKATSVLYHIQISDVQSQQPNFRALSISRAAHLIRVLSHYARYQEAEEYAKMGLDLIAGQEISFPHTYEFYCYLSDYRLRLGDEKGLDISENLYKQVIENPKLEEFKKRICQYYTGNLANYIQHFKLNEETKIELNEKLLNATTQIEQFATEGGARIYNYLMKATALKIKRENNQAISYLAKAYKLVAKTPDKDSLKYLHVEACEIYRSLAIELKTERYINKATFRARKAYDLMSEEKDQIFKNQIERINSEHELEKEKMKNEALKKELKMTSLHLQEKINTLDELKKYVNSLKKTDYQMGKLILTISNKIESIKVSEEERSILMQKIDNKEVDFARKISEKHPNLSALEIRMCGLFKTGMTNKELSKLFGLSDRSYEQHRYRIKKRMNLTADDGLVEHLNNL